MIPQAEEAGRAAGRAFRLALEAEVDRLVHAAGVAARASLPADEAFAPGRSGGSRGAGGVYARPRAGGRGRPSGGPETDAPAYRGADGPNVESWLRFAQAPRDEGGLGLTRAQAAGVVGNLIHESGPNILPNGPRGDHGTAHGAAQWRLERFANLKRKAAEWGLDWRTTAAQQRFMRWELDNSEQGAAAALSRATTPEEAAHVFNRRYERSADPGVGRRQTARRLYEKGK